MDPLTIGAIGLGAGSLVAGLWNARKQREAQAEANRQNIAYNSPTSQMQRLKDANLNPNLVYSQGNTVGNTEIKPVDTYGMDSSVKNALSTFMQVKNFDADLRAKEHANNLTSATMPSTIAQAKATAARVQTDSDVAKVQLKEAKARADIAEHDRDVITGKKVGLASHDRGIPGLINVGGRFIKGGLDYMVNDMPKVGLEVFKSIFRH